MESGRPETDLIQIRNIEGLGPVKAAVNTAPFGSVDGEAYVGSLVNSRNIVLTLRPNPDWDVWSYEKLRRLLYSYFMPKLRTKLTFYSDDMPPVEISGYVEDVSPNMFSKDTEILVSIICPDPYFTSVDPIVITGTADRDNSSPALIDYNGSIEAGVNVRVNRTADPAPTTIGVQIGDPTISYFTVTASVSSSLYFVMNSLPMQKYVQNVNTSTGVATNLLQKVQEGSSWPVLQPGENEFSVITNQGSQDWQLTYYERFGGL
jgi:hypothetical protein